MAKSKKSWWKMSILLIAVLLASALFAMSYFQTAEEVKTSSATTEQTKTDGITEEKDSTPSTSVDWTQKIDSVDFHLEQAETLKKEADKITAKEKAVEVSVPQPAKVSVPAKKQEQSKKIEQKKIALKEKETALVSPVTKKAQETKTDESSLMITKKEIFTSSNTQTANKTETLVSVEFTEFTKLPVIEIQNIEVKEMQKIFSQAEIHSMTASLVTDVKEVKKWKKLQKDNEKTEAEIPTVDTILTVQADTSLPIIAPVLQYPVFDEEERLYETVQSTENQPTETKIVVEEKSENQSLPVTETVSGKSINMQKTDTAIVALEFIVSGNSKAGMRHIAKENKKPLYETVYDTILPFNDMATAFVREVTGKDTTWKLIDLMGADVKITPFKHVEEPHYGLSVVKLENGKFSHAKESGKLLYETIQFDGIMPFHLASGNVCAFGQITGQVSVDTEKIPNVKPTAEKKKKKTVITVVDPIYQIFPDGSIVLFQYR